MIKVVMECIIRNSAKIEQNLLTLRNELLAVQRVYSQQVIQKLTTENARLAQQVHQAKQKLIHLETFRGVKQISVGVREVSSNAPIQCQDVPQVQLVKESAKVSTEKAAKKEKKKKVDDGVAGVEEMPPHVGRLDLRIGRIIKVEKHPDADSLYVSRIECGDDMPRTVVSGLVKFVPIEQLQGKMVVVLCNLKPVKMRGVLSEAMVMCASTPEAVEVLCPPMDAQVGDPVHCDSEDYPRLPDAQLNPKKKILEMILPDLCTDTELRACYVGHPLLVCGQPITSSSLANVQIK